MEEEGGRPSRRPLSHLREGFQVQMGHGYWRYRAGEEWPAVERQHSDEASTAIPSGRDSQNRCNIQPVLRIKESDHAFKR
jgi:hypothetical protein